MFSQSYIESRIYDRDMLCQTSTALSCVGAFLVPSWNSIRVKDINLDSSCASTAISFCASSALDVQYMILPIQSTSFNANGVFLRFPFAFRSRRNG